MKTSYLLLLLLILPFFSFEVFGDSPENQIIVETDRVEYVTGDSLLVSGMVQEKKMPIIAMRVYDPSGLILSANNVEIQDDNSFSKEIFLDSPFYDEAGKYSIKFDYGKIKEEFRFEIVSNNIFNDDIFEEEIIPEVIVLVTDQSVYQDDEFVVIAGLVSTIEEPSILIGIYDPFGIPTGFYFAAIDSNLEFSTSFLAKSGVNFKTEGTYSVIAHYGESEHQIDFDFVKKLDQEIEDVLKEDAQEEVLDDIEEEANDDVKEENIDESNRNIDNSDEEKSSNKNEIIDKTSSTILVSEKDNDSIEKEHTKSIIQNNIVKTTSKKSYNNLSVEDIQLGKMLNQITLNCDNDQYRYSISYYDGMGPALIRLCKYSESIAYFNKSLSDDPKNVEILTNKGTALSKLGLHDEAILYFDSALANSPNYFPALNNKANTLAEMGNLEEAITLYKLSMDSNPNNLLLKYNLEKTIEIYINSNKSIPVEPQITNPVHEITDEVVDKTVSTIKEVNENPSNFLEQISIVFSAISASLFGITQ